MPYSRSPEASAPSTKYFNPASEDRRLSRANAVSTYSASDCSSSPRYRLIIELADTMIIMPVTDSSISTGNSNRDSPSDRL